MSHWSCRRFFAALIAVCALSQPAFAQTETPITIHVVAESGMPLNDIAGESQITLRDRTSGDVLASGETFAGKFDVSIDLARPTPATIGVTGPLANIANMSHVSRDILLVPGKDYSAGGGIKMILPGMLVRLLSPTPDQSMSETMSEDILVTAYVVGLDGQPVAAKTHEVDVIVYNGSVAMGTSRMVETKEPGRFATKLKFPHKGIYGIVVTAYDPAGKTAGMDQSVFVVTAAPEKKQ